MRCQQLLTVLQATLLVLRPEASCASARNVSTSNTFTVLVPLEASSSSVDDAKSNEPQAVSMLDVNATITHVVVAGGRGPAECVRGEVASAQLDSHLIAAAFQVKDVELTNLDLVSAVEGLLTMLPPNASRLSLANDLLTAFPTISLLPLQSLASLNLDANYIQEVDASAYSNSISSLSMQDNEMHTFRGYFPSIEHLYLGSNQLSAIPENVYNFPHLKMLQMAGNPPLSRAFTSTQAEFLRSLDWDLSSGDFEELAICDGELEQIHDVVVCIGTRPGATGARSDHLIRTEVDRKLATYYSNNYYCPGYYSGGTLAGAIIGTIAGMLLIGGLLWWWRRNTVQQEKETTKQYIAAWLDPQLLPLQLNADEIKDVRRIGGGAFADVWLVKYRGTQLLASKRLHKDPESRQFTKGFVEEIKLQAHFDHPNIVKLVGVAWRVETDMQALFTYMEGGDLRAYLMDGRTPCVWTTRKLQVAVDVAEALVYVHSFSRPVVHRDLKSRNILLSRDLQAKLTDFGVSRFLSENNTMTQAVGTSRWEAPEVLSGQDDYDQAADIFSLGVVLSELDTHDIPYSDACGPSGNKLPEVAILQMIAAGTLRPSFTAACPADIRALADRCLATNPNDRPAATEVAYALRTAIV